MKKSDFQECVWQHYDLSKRTMPWRECTDPYWILVSEIMLQQTQAARVLPKFKQFIQSFPTVTDLSDASFASVLAEWSGLGYNRRAKFLYQAAKQIVAEYGGRIPEDRALLEKLPGIGTNTAGAILAYAYNMPVVYIETNIRTVYLHHFFPGKTNITDKQLIPFIEKTLPNSCPKHAQSDADAAFSLRSTKEAYVRYDDCASEKKRSIRAESDGGGSSSARSQAIEVCMFREWYWALMDYGTHLKATRPNPSRASKHHTKQSKFEGSPRQLRGQILRNLTKGTVSKKALKEKISDPRFEQALQKLASEGMLKIKDSTVEI